MVRSPSAWRCFLQHRLDAGVGNVEHTVQAHQLEQGAHLRRERAEAQVAAVSSQLPLCGQQRAQARAVDEADIQEVHNQQRLAGAAIVAALGGLLAAFQALSKRPAPALRAD